MSYPFVHFLFGIPAQVLAVMIANRGPVLEINTSYSPQAVMSPAVPVCVALLRVSLIARWESRELGLRVRAKEEVSGVGENTGPKME